MNINISLGISIDICIIWIFMLILLRVFVFILSQSAARLPRHSAHCPVCCAVCVPVCSHCDYLIASRIPPGLRFLGSWTPCCFNWCIACCFLFGYWWLLRGAWCPNMICSKCPDVFAASAAWPCCITIADASERNGTLAEFMLGGSSSEVTRY